MANFSHRDVYSVSVHYPMSISAIDPVCPQAISAMTVTLFPSEMLCVTNVPLINCNNTLFCSELNGEHIGGRFRYYDSYFLRHTHAKLEKCRFRENLTFDLSVLRQILT